jgi:ABC-type antimicrobial peptide transport system permease subunit
VRIVLLILCIIVLALLGILLFRQDKSSVVQDQSVFAGHVYASWETMEFDK